MKPTDDCFIDNVGNATQWLQRTPQMIALRELMAYSELSPCKNFSPAFIRRAFFCLQFRGRSYPRILCTGLCITGCCRLQTLAQYRFASLPINVAVQGFCEHGNLLRTIALF